MTPPNGTGYILPATGPQPLANYPHARIIPISSAGSGTIGPAPASGSGSSPSSGGRPSTPSRPSRPPPSPRLVFVSGTSSRRADGSYEGCVRRANGTYALDCGVQTAAALRAVDAVLRGASGASGASVASVGGAVGLGAVVDATVFLTDIRADYAAMNAAWNRVWPDRARAPARTCVQVAALPSEKMCVEVKCQAVLFE